MHLLPSLLPGDRSRTSNPQFWLATHQQTPEPTPVPAGLDPPQPRPLQSFVENPRFLRMQQPALDQLARSLVQHCYPLKARMKVTAYILHMRPPSSRALRSLPNRVYSRLLGAVVVIQSTGAPRKSCPFKTSLARSGGIPRKYSLP